MLFRRVPSPCVGIARDRPNFWIPPINSGSGKATDFKFCTHIHRVNQNKSPWNILGKVAVGIVRESRKFSWHPYMGRIVRSSLRQHSFLVYFQWRSLCTLECYIHVLRNTHVMHIHVMRPVRCFVTPIRYNPEVRYWIDDSVSAA